jgi:hypothetical protein
LIFINSTDRADNICRGLIIFAEGLIIIAWGELIIFAGGCEKSQFSCFAKVSARAVQIWSY